ncbi:hypothetical protein BROC_00070 [Candidatus Brocadiaceae bacterium]|nr:hypothetical protein BROC_00070 [Candidatus Brocadiaceae bacterium]
MRGLRFSSQPPYLLAKPNFHMLHSKDSINFVGLNHCIDLVNRLSFYSNPRVMKKNLDLYKLPARILACINKGKRWLSTSLKMYMEIIPNAF